MFLFWCLPSFVFALGFFVSPGWRTVLWTLSLGFMGTLCLLNASRCSRIHCYFTGPFFILGAVTSLGYGLGSYPLGRPGGNGLVTLQLLARSCSAPFRNSTPAGIGEIDQSEL